MANQYFENEVIENRYESILATAVDMNTYVTVNTKLATEPGMILNVNVYGVSGDVEDLAMGEGNSGDIDVTLASVPYEVGVTQGRFAAFDEQVMSDGMVLDAGLRGSAETMVNDFTAKAFVEFNKATKRIDYDASGITFANVVDALAELNLEGEEGYTLFISPGMKASVRKSLADDLKYASDYVRSGYIGSVAGVPVVVSKAVTADTAFIASKAAVTVFIKKGVEVEQLREPNTRKTTYFIRKVALVALTDATKIVALDKP